MPIATLTTAEDEILAHFAAFWAGLSSAPPLVYDDKTGEPPATGPYARVSVQYNPVGFGQRTLGGVGGRRFGRAGILTVQLFTPFGDGLTLASAIADAWADAFEGESTGSDRIEFRNANVVRLGEVGAFYQTNLSVEFNFDRVK